MTLGCLLADAWLSEQGRERLAEIKHWPRVLSPHRSGGWGEDVLDYSKRWTVLIHNGSYRQ